MKGAIIITLLTLSAILLIYFAFEDTNLLFAILSNLGILAILAAIRYTIGASMDIVD
jgi:1,4-dihydroxy-2-naphthoate octaprenyltransferase